ncbi:MAG: vWA domain-containing protein [Pseudobdellovibrio sp.]
MKLLKQRFIFLSIVLVVFGCTDRSSQLVPLPVQTTEAVSQKPIDLVSFNPKVDILFVIDNSGSMGQAQANLSQNAVEFSNAITAMSILDYHIGVTSTDMDDCYSGCGNLLGKPFFVDKNTPNGAAALAKNMLLGTSGSGTEEMFNPVLKALTINTSNNSNFYRQDAYLAVIFITDAKDQGYLSAAEFLKKVISIKNDATKILAYGVIRTLADEQSCYSAEGLDGKLEEFLASVVNADKKQNNVFSLCAPDYGIKLAQFAKDIVQRSSGIVRLLRIPNVKTIQVSYGTQQIPNSMTDGWVYEISTNSIILSSEIKWLVQPNAKLSIDFEAIDITKN